MKRSAAIMLCLWLVLQGSFLEPGLAAQSPAGKSIYWGALIDGDAYNLDDPPWDMSALDMFESSAGKKISILHWSQPWWDCYSVCGYQHFNAQIAQYDAVRQRGIIPLVDWLPWDPSGSLHDGQQAFALSRIINGQHDSYIRRWAAEAKAWGHPFFLRFAHEMNGDWFPWSERRNGNSAGEFVQAWRHMHDIFTQAGATNVTWVWCPNVDNPDRIPLRELYPGEGYVDWTCMDGYNWGTNPVNPYIWKGFYDMFKPTYDQLLALAPGKPVMVGETASSEIGGSKPAWIADALGTQLPVNFPNIEAVLWFNWNVDSMDWAIESSAASKRAFAAAIASPYYIGSEFSSLSISPIPPYTQLPPFRRYLPLVRK